MRHAVLDLGSNSFHVLVADVDGPSITPVLREREMLHLGREVASTGSVPPAAERSAVATVTHLAELGRRSGARTVTAVATAALRDAVNGPAVLQRLEEAADTPVQVLDGFEEARLAYLGVRASVAVHDEPVLVFDLGGGSLELAIGVGGQVVWATSTPLGASRLSAGVSSDPLATADRDWLRGAVDTAVDPLRELVAAHEPATCVAVGGTVRALGRLSAAAHAQWLPASVNQLSLDTTDLAALRDRLVGVDLARRRRLPGMKSRRADHVHVAAVVLARALERLGVRTVTISDWGLREGLLLDGGAGPVHPDAVTLRDGEVTRLRRAFGSYDPHPDHVATLAGELFDATTTLHRLDEHDRELLILAARLHALGETLALRRQHVHGAYLVENAELRGFTPTETAMLTTLVRFHPSRGIGSGFAPFEALTNADRDRVRRLLPLLQIADGLDRAHDQAVRGVGIRRVADRIELHLDGGDPQVADSELARRSRLFEEVYQVSLHVDHRSVA